MVFEDLGLRRAKALERIADALEKEDVRLAEADTTFLERLKTLESIIQRNANGEQVLPIGGVLLALVQALIHEESTKLGQ